MWIAWAAMGTAIVLLVAILGVLYMGQRSDADALERTVAAREDTIATLNDTVAANEETIAANEETIASLEGENAKVVTDAQNSWELFNDWLTPPVYQWSAIAQQLNATLKALFDGPPPVRFTPFEVIPVG
jgi:uncharacterized coiled-coil protein SlyX